MAKPDKTLIDLLTKVRDRHLEMADEMDHYLRAAYGDGVIFEPADKIYIIDAAAIPAEYFLRESVLEAVRTEITKDYKNSDKLPAGVSLKSEVEARSGETEEISDKTNDELEPGTESEDPKDGGDNGSPSGSSDQDTSGLPGQSDRVGGSESDKGPRE